MKSVMRASARGLAIGRAPTMGGTTAIIDMGTLRVTDAIADELARFGPSRDLRHGHDGLRGRRTAAHA